MKKRQSSFKVSNTIGFPPFFIVFVFFFIFCNVPCNLCDVTVFQVVRVVLLGKSQSDLRVVPNGNSSAG